LDRYKKTHSNEIFDAQAGTILELREFSIVVDPHGSADEKLRLLVTDCVTARPTSGVRFLIPNLQRAHRVGSVKERLTGLLDLRKSTSSSQKVDSHKSAPTATQAIQLDSSSDSDIHEVGSPLINTQVQLASQMPSRRPPRQTPDFAVASGTNLSRPIEARRSVPTTKEPMAHLYSLLENMQQGFSKPLLPSTTNPNEATTHNQIHSVSEPRPKRLGQHGTNKLTHPDDIETDVVDLEQDIPTTNGAAAVDIPPSTKEEQRSSKVRVKQEGVKYMDDAKSIATPSKIEGHSQLNRDDATSEAMDVDNLGDDTTNIPEELLDRPAEDVELSIRSNSVEHSSPKDTAFAVPSLASRSAPLEATGGTGVNISCLHQNNFRALHQLIRATEDLEVSQDQMRILNKPESWQYPAPPMRLPQPNIPIALLREFKQHHEADAPEVVEPAVSVAGPIVDMKDAASADDANNTSDDEEAAYSGWDASSSPDRMRQVQGHLKAPSSPVGPPAGILKDKRGTSNNHNLPPDSSAALLLEDASAEDSSPSAQLDTASSDDPRLALAQLEPRTVPQGGSHFIHLASDVGSNSKRTTMLYGHVDPATLNIPELDSSDIEMDVPQALPLPSSQPSRNKLQTSPASRGDISQHSCSPSTPKSAYQPSPYQLVPGSFNSTQVERYHTMQMPITALDGAAESKPVPAFSSPISITSGQRTMPPQSTSPMSTGTKRLAPDAGMPSHQLPAHKKRREQSFDWDRQSQVEDPIELSRRMRREFLSQRKTAGKDAEMRTHLSESLAMPDPPGHKPGVNASAHVSTVSSVGTDNDQTMHDIHPLHMTDQDVHDGLQLNHVNSTLTMNTSSRPMEGMSTDQSTAAGQLRIYTAFKAAYSSYSGDLKHFANLCRMIYKLTQGQRLLHRSLWDDFIIRHKTDYPAYLMQCAEEGTSVKTYDAYYQDEIEEPIHIRRIVTPLTLEAVLSSPDPSAPQKHSFDDRKPATPTFIGDEAKPTHNHTPSPSQHQQTGFMASNNASPQGLLRMAQRNAAISTTVQTASPGDAGVQPASSTPRARAPDIARQHVKPLANGQKAGASIQPRTNSTAKAQDPELCKDRPRGSTMGVDSPTAMASQHVRSATFIEPSHSKAMPLGAATRAQPVLGTKHIQSEVIAQQKQTRKDTSFANVPTGPKASMTSRSRSNREKATIPGLNLLNSSSQVRGKAPPAKSKRNDDTRVQANGHPRSAAGITPKALPPTSVPRPPVAHHTAGLQATKRKRGPFLHTAISNAPKRRDAAHDPAADPAAIGQGKISEARNPKA